VLPTFRTGRSKVAQAGGVAQQTRGGCAGQKALDLSVVSEEALGGFLLSLKWTCTWLEAEYS
jgi:hypothetical protein